MDEKNRAQQEDELVDKGVETGDNPVEDGGITSQDLSTSQRELGTTDGEAVDKTVGDVEELPRDVEQHLEDVDKTVDEIPLKGDFVEETVENVDNMGESVEKTLPKKGKGAFSIILGLVAFVGLLGYCWFATGGGLTKVPDLPVAYAKDNGLYLYDLKNDPYMVTENISDGGTYQYMTTAWGTGFSQSGNDFYYLGDVSERGPGNLYHRDLKKSGEDILIGANVLDFSVGKDGKTLAYLSIEENIAVLSVYKDGVSRKIGENILLEQGTYELSSDGNFVVYISGDGTNNALFVCETAEGSAPISLSDTVAIYSVTDSGKIYYVSLVGQSYSLFSYEMGKTPTLVAENVTYMSELANGTDMIYCSMDTGVIPYADFITDDITDLEGLSPEKQASVAEIRAAMAEGKGIEPLLQDCYIVTSNGATNIGRQLISVAPIGKDGSHYVGFGVKTPPPMLLSEVDSLDAALYQYYEGLAYGEKDVFVGSAQMQPVSLQSNNVIPTSVKIGDDGKTVAYFVADTTTGVNTLMTEILGEKEAPTEIGANVETMNFLGASQNLGYFYDYTDGVGTLGQTQKGSPQELDTNGSRVIYAEDQEVMFYITKADPDTGSGDLMMAKDGTSQKIDEGVFNFQYQGNGNVAYFKNYSLENAVGELHYFNGKETKLVDTGVSALYMK